MDLRDRLARHRVEERRIAWEGTFLDYFELVRKRPEIAELAHARIYRMIMSAGVQTGERGDKRYNFFAEEIFGLDKPMAQLVEYFNSAGRRLEVRKRILLLMGPVGGGKSTLVTLLKRGLERFSRTDEGALYAIKGCPMQEEPLHLIPHELRADITREHGIYIEGDLCPSCHQMLQETYRGNAEEVPVQRIVFSEKNRVGIGTFTPSDPKSQDISELTGSVDLATVGQYGSESDPRAYRFDGELNVANRGLMEFIEMLKCDEKFLYGLLTLSQEQVCATTLAPGPMLTVVYARVSTEEQARSGFSLGEQVRVCTERALEVAPGARVVHFTDQTSGEVLERTGLQGALALVRQQRVACLVCLDPDRLARRLMHQLLITDEIERNGCRLEFVQHDYQSNPEGVLFYQMRGAIAEFEKAKILERTSRGQRGKIAAGGLPHLIRMYGYRFRKGAGKQARAQDVLVPEQREEEWVRQMYAWCAQERLSPARIAERLAELGVPTKTGRGAWTGTQVRRILHNAAYATGRLALGKRDHRGLGVARRLPAAERSHKGLRLTAKPKPPDQWQYVQIKPLVPVAMWERVQAVLGAGGRPGAPRCAVGGSASGAGRPVARRPLSGLGCCGLCGGALHYVNGCKIACARRGRGGCTLPAKPKAAVEEAVWLRVERLVGDRDRLQTEWRRMQASAADGTHAGAPAADAVQVELHHRRAELERLGQLYVRGLWPAQKALSAMEAVHRQIEALLQRLTGSQTPRASPNQPASAATALRTLASDQRAELIRLAVDRYEMRPSARGAAPRVEVFPSGDGTAAIRRLLQWAGSHCPDTPRQHPLAQQPCDGQRPMG